MVGGPHAKSVQRDLVERPQPVPQVGGTCFRWSLAKGRTASLVLFGAATAAAAGFAVSVSFVQCLCLAWLVSVGLLMHCLSRRAFADTVVLSVDEHGILDRRLMLKHIEWHEIQAIYPSNADRGGVVSIELRWPNVTLRETRWPVRIGHR
jgi:hypothetical protein